MLLVDWGNLSGYDLVAKAALTIFNGHAAVFIFFVISGAVLYKGLMNANTTLVGGSVGFIIRRFFRIYPALFVCVLACAAAFALFGMNFGADDILANLLLYRFPINGATWTLQVEMIASLLLVICFFGSLLLGRTWGGVIAAIAIVVMFRANVPSWASDSLIRMFWLCFALGVLIPTPVGQWVAERSPTWIWLLALILVLTTKSNVQYVSAAFLVNLLYYQRAGQLGVVLQSQVAQFFGRISYSFYLFNVLFLEIICQFLRTQPWAAARPVEIGIAAGIVIVLLTTPVAYLSWIFIENPMNRLGQRITARWRPSPSLEAKPASA